jgi:hypothetical protein
MEYIRPVVFCQETIGLYRQWSTCPAPFSFPVAHADAAMRLHTPSPCRIRTDGLVLSHLDAVVCGDVYETLAADDLRARRPGVRPRPQPRAKAGATGPGVDRLLIVPSVAEPTPPPPGRPSGHARPVRGRRAADAGRHAIGLLDIGVTPKAPWSSSTSSRRPVELGATTRSPCRLHGSLPASPHGPRELRHARRPNTVEEQDSTDIPARRSGQALGGHWVRRWRVVRRRCAPDRYSGAPTWA